MRNTSEVCAFATRVAGWSTRRAAFVLVLAGVLSLGVAARAQEVTASINGVVTDPSGGAVVGAKVTANDLARGTAYPTTTNSVGQYTLARLPVGRYSVRVEATGFQASVQPSVLLQLNQVAKIDFALVVGSMNQTVEVSTEAPILQTESTQVGTVIDARTNEQLPLANRNFVQLTLLAPGAITTDPSEITGVQSPESILSGGRPYINGNREQTDNFILDGMDANQVSENAVAYRPSVDAIQEFDLITNNAPAEFGNFMGGVINVSLKSGTNTFHGGAYEFLRNDKLNANDWANNWSGVPRSPLRWNDFGADVGGPIKKDKLFFFADYEGQRFDQPANGTPFTVLTVPERTGDFGALCPAGFNGAGQCVVNGATVTPGTTVSGNTQLVNPTTKAFYPFNKIPSGDLSPVATAITSSSLYPVPTSSGLINNINNTETTPVNNDQGDIKVDWNASDNNRMFGRYSQGYISNPVTNSIPILYNSSNVFPSHNGVLDYTRTFSPELVNEARFGVNYSPVITGAVSGQGLSPSSIGIPGVPVDVLPGFVFESGNLFGNNSNGQGQGLSFGNPEVFQEFADTVIQAEDTAIWTKGAHTLHMGFQFFRERIDTFYSGNAGIAGQFDFSGQYSGAPEADFMLGLPAEVQGGISGGTWGQRSSIFAAFLQDDWHATRNLTLNVGLRWELHTPWYEVHNREANFGEYTGQEEFPGQDGFPQALYNQYNGITNFEPRVGVAWSPHGGRMVIRAAYTLSSFLEGTGTNLRLTLNPPFATEHDILTAEFPSTLSDGYNPFISNPGDQFAGASLRLWDPNVRPAVSNQWNLSVQEQLTNSTTLQVGYVGQRNTHLMVPVLASQKVLNPDGTVSPALYLSGNPTLQSEIGAAKLTISNGNQDYDALQVVFQKRLASGLEFQANYTWSKCMTDSIGYYGGYGQAQGDHYYWQNTYNSTAEWGPCYYDSTNAFNGYVTYDLPFGRGRAFGKNMNPVANAIVGDWQINSIVTLHSGFPITIQTGGIDTSGTGSFGPRANCIAPGKVFGTQPSPTGGYQWFDPTSYVLPATGTFGNCGVGTIRGPGLHTMDLSLAKKFAITERQNLEFRAEAINFTNTPILNAPVDSLGSTLGQITSSQGARNIQFGLKYNF